MLLVSVLALLALAGARAELGGIGVAGVDEAGRNLLQATLTCFPCPVSGLDPDECGALVTTPGVAPYHDGNYRSYCKCVRLRQVKRWR
jgi:hypothetical protein